MMFSEWLKLHKLYIALIFLNAFDLEQKTDMQMCGSQVASHILDISVCVKNIITH